MAISHLDMLSPTALVCACILLLIFKRVYFELTTGARRRRMIREHGCEPCVRYENKGILGKLFGLDVIRSMMATAREGRMFEAGRLRNFANGRKTVMNRFLFEDSEFAATSSLGRRRLLTHAK